MGATGTAIVYAVLLWWFSTGLILFLNHLPARSFRASMLGGSIVAVAAIIGLAAAARLPTTSGTYVGFTCAVLLWGWHEMSFFMGIITGPRRVAGPPSRGWVRFRDAAGTCLYHQMAVAATGVLVLLLSRGHPNQVGSITFLALWVMRLSATFNVFLGVRNLNLQFLPPHLAYLEPYMAHRRMNWLLPLSTIAGVAGCVEAARSGATLLATMLALGSVEHLCMVLPVPFAALWQWSLDAARRSRIAVTIRGLRPNGARHGKRHDDLVGGVAASTQRR